MTTARLTRDPCSCLATFAIGCVSLTTYFLLIGALFLLALCGVAAISVATRSIAQPSPRKRDLGLEAVDRSVVGGLTWHVGGVPWSVTTPLARLSLFDAGVRVGPSHRLWSAFVPTWSLTWSELDRITQHGITLEIAPRDSKDSLRFHAFSSRARQRVLNMVGTHLVKADEP